MKYVAFLVIILSIVSNKSLANFSLGNTNGLSQTQSIDDKVIELEWNIDGTLLAVARSKSGVHIFDESLEEVFHIDVPILRATEVVDWHPGGDSIAIVTNGDSKLEIQVWQMDATEPTAIFDTATREVVYIEWSPDGSRLMIGGQIQGEVWDFEKQELLFEVDATLTSEEPDPNIIIAEIQWSPDGKFIATTAANGQTAIWSDTGELVEVFTPRGRIQWGANGDLAIANSNTLTVFEFPKLVARYSIQFASNFSLDIFWRNSTIIYVTPDEDFENKLIYVIEAETGEILSNFIVPITVVDIAFNSKAEQITYIDERDDFQIIDLTISD